MPRIKSKLKRYQFSLALFTEMFITGNEIDVIVDQGWPKDSQIVGLHSDVETYSFSVIIYSKKFDKIKKGDEIPYGEIHFASPAN